MIDITNVNLVEFAKKIYELSVPQGLGFLHYDSTPLSDENAKTLIHDSGRIALDMDYVSGRSCKMTVLRDIKTRKLYIPDSWYDHTDRIFSRLLNHFGIQKDIQNKHNISCACIDCESARSME